MTFTAILSSPPALFQSVNIPAIIARIRDKRSTAPPRSPYLILFTSCSAMFLDFSNLSAITIALPTIEKEFGVNLGDLQWVVSAYALTFGAFLLLGGRGGDIFGHRRVLVFGMTLFALFTLICGLSPTFIGLVIARAFQGIGAAFTFPSAQAFISLTFTDPKSKAFALGIWGGSASAGVVVGLILGGVLTDFLGWRWVFWLSLILSGIVIPLACLILPHTDGHREPEIDLSVEHRQPNGPTSKTFYHSVLDRLIRFDVLGITLGLPGILLLNYAFAAANTVGWGKEQIIGTLIASIILLGAFIKHENKASVSLLPTHLFRSLSFNLNLILAAFAFAIRQSCTYFLTLQFQSYGNSPIHTAVLFIPVGITALIAVPLTGRLVSILGPKTMFIFGHILTLPGPILFSFITPSSSYFAFAFPGLIIYIIGIGFVYVTANFVVVSSARKTDQGATSAVFNVALQVGGSVLGLAVFTAVAEGISRRYGEPMKERVNQVGYRAVYYSCIILCVIGLLLSLFAVRDSKERDAEDMGGGNAALELEVREEERRVEN